MSKRRSRISATPLRDAPVSTQHRASLKPSQAAPLRAAAMPTQPRPSLKPSHGTLLRDVPAPDQTRASVKPSKARPLATVPTPTRQPTTPIDKHSSRGRSSRLGRGRFTFKSDVIPQKDVKGIEEGQTASEALLSRLGFMLCDGYWQ